MDYSTPQIQLPNPQQAMFNSASFQSPMSSSSSSFFTLRNIAIISLIVLVVGGVGMGVKSVFNTTNSYKKKIAKQSDQISQILDEANQSSGISVVGKAEATYDNPFDKNNSYQNPFDENGNPF